MSLTLRAILAPEAIHLFTIIHLRGRETSGIPLRPLNTPDEFRFVHILERNVVLLCHFFNFLHFHVAASTFSLRLSIRMVKYNNIEYSTSLSYFSDKPLSLRCFYGLLDILHQIIDVLDPHGQTQQRIGDAYPLTFSI